MPTTETKGRAHKGSKPSGAAEQRLHARRRRRIYVVLAVSVGVALLLAWRLTYWQLVAREQVLRHRAVAQVRPAQQPPRGTIRDRNGYLLAIDTTEYKLGVSANLVAHAESLAREVAPLIGRPEDELVELFSRNDAYIPIAAGLPYTVGQALINLNNPALVIEPVLKRAYPNGPLAAHVLGFVNEAGTGYGVERTMAKWLDGQVPPNTDAPAAEEIKLGARPFAPMREGVDIILTLDRNVQFMAEQELADAIARYDAEGGTIIVMDPHTGDVLAMANWPSYDPNQYATTPPELFANPATAKQYEPGSVFKAITVASALDSGAISPNLVYRDTGVIEVGGRLIRNWDGGSRGLITISEILGYSVNTAVAWINLQLGVERFVEYVRRFGFGEPTNLGLGEEASGFIKEPGDGLWHPSDVGTNAFGQGIAVTPIQMIDAYTAFLNDGVVVQPRLVKAVVNHGHLEETTPRERSRAIAPETARFMQEVLVNAVELGIENARIEGYRVGGKSGTAEVPIPGGYHPTDTIASFIGFVPAGAPKFLILVKLDKPKGVYRWGSQSAAPTFRRLARRLLTYWNVPPDGSQTAQRP